MYTTSPPPSRRKRYRRHSIKQNALLIKPSAPRDTNPVEISSHFILYTTSPPQRKKISKITYVERHTLHVIMTNSNHVRVIAVQPIVIPLTPTNILEKPQSYCDTLSPPGGMKYQTSGYILSNSSIPSSPL